MPPIEVELFTTDHAIRGFIENAGERLSDIMNDNKKSGVLLTDAYMIRLNNPGNANPLKILQANVHKDQVLFARPVQQDLTHKSLYRRATRQLYRVAINLPLFELQGVIHLTGRLDVSRVLVERPEDFIPITNGRAFYMFNPRIEINSNIFVVNKHQIALIAELHAEKQDSTHNEFDE